MSPFSHMEIIEAVDTTEDCSTTHMKKMFYKADPLLPARGQGHPRGEVRYAQGVQGHLLGSLRRDEEDHGAARG